MCEGAFGGMDDRVISVKRNNSIVNTILAARLLGSYGIALVLTGIVWQQVVDGSLRDLCHFPKNYKLLLEKFLINKIKKGL